MTAILPDLLPVLPEIIPQLPPDFIPFIPPPPGGSHRVQVLPVVLRALDLTGFLGKGIAALNSLLGQVGSIFGAPGPPAGNIDISQMLALYEQLDTRFQWAAADIKDYAYAQLQALANTIAAYNFQTQNQLGGIYIWMQGIMAGTIPIAGTSTQLDPATVRNLVQPQIQPLIDNLGVLTAQVDLLTQTVGTLQAQLSPDALRQKVGIPDASTIPTLLAVLAPVAALIAADLPTRMAQAEDCCAANTSFRNNWQDLLNKLKPLLDALKLLDLALLAKLLYDLEHRGLRGLVDDLKADIASDYGAARGILGTFLGV